MSNPRCAGSHYGVLERIEDEPIITDPRGLFMTRCVWRPPARLRDHLPGAFDIPFRLIADDEFQRLAPAEPTSDFARRASIVGMAILKTNDTSAETLASYRMMYFLYQLAPRLRECLDRRLKVYRDLIVKQADGSQDSILPQDLGTGSGAQSWHPVKLLQIGQHAAEEAGCISPSFETKLAFGIDCDARQRPLDVGSLTPEKFQGLLRMCLFDAGPVAQRDMTDKIKERVYARLVDAIQWHIEDNSQRFRRWFFDNFPSIVGQIGKRRESGGPIQRDVVHQAILELAFDSVRCVGQLISLCMGNVRNCFDPPLSDGDGEIFRLMYQESRYLADVPLILLGEQLATLRPSVEAVLNEPQSPQPWGRLLRAMSTYSAMLQRRREVDRERKRLQPQQLQFEEELPDVDQSESAEEDVDMAVDWD